MQIEDLLLLLKYFFDLQLTHITYLLYFQQKAEQMGLLISFVNGKKTTRTPITEEYNTLFNMLN